MNYLMTALEKLKNIKSFIIDTYQYENIDAWSDKEIIKYVNKEFDFSSIEASLKALEIIKEKKVSVKDLINAKTLNIYNCNRDWWEMLVQEEFDLLKEILL